MIMLDSIICIYIINNRPPNVSQKLREYFPENVTLSAISAAELTFGVEKSKSLKNKAALQAFLASLKILPFNEEAIWHYGKLRSKLESSGKVIGPLDMLIAAHALSLNATLVTNNLKEFERIEGLLLENWV